MKNDFKWGPEQQTFKQNRIMQSPWASQDRRCEKCSTLQSVRMVLPVVSGKSIWGNTRTTPGVLELGYKRFEACYIPAEKKILETYEVVQAASEVIGTEVQLLLAS